jgi:hypothetical protein
MGFLDKVKNTLSGDWADVAVRVDGPLVRGGVMNATVDIVVKDSPIKIEGVTLELRCEEFVQIRNATLNNGSTSATGTVNDTETLFSQEVVVAGAGELAAGGTFACPGQIPIPATAPPSVLGRNARFDWQVRARIGMKGNDPDSGWQTLQVT